MRLSLFNRLLLALCLVPLASSAMEIQPGLWEISSSNMQVDGQALPDMQQMFEQMKNLPPEQRQIMEQMMAKQGVQLGDKGIRVCMSEAQIKAQEIPLQDPQSGCTHEITERSASLWKFRYSCPQSQGEGETRFISDKQFTSEVTDIHDGKSSSMQSHGRWLSADCGALQPR
nr:DUF3617 domain-containing protein [uncultured Pseudomonas sp.]